MNNKRLQDQLASESEKLNDLRKAEEVAYSKFCHARNERDSQEREVSYLFRKLFDRVKADL
jgi:hypothetical protein